MGNPLKKKKRIVAVGSNITNLAGDVHKRPNLLKTYMFNEILYHEYGGIGKALTESYLGGPGIKNRGMVRRAQFYDYYNKIGQPPSGIRSLNSHKLAEITETLRALHDIPTITVDEYDIGEPDPDWWIYPYLLEHRPALLDSEFALDYNRTEHEFVIEVYDDVVYTTPGETELDPPTHETKFEVVETLYIPAGSYDPDSDDWLGGFYNENLPPESELLTDEIIDEIPEDLELTDFNLDEDEVDEQEITYETKTTVTTVFDDPDLEPEIHVGIQEFTVTIESNRKLYTRTVFEEVEGIPSKIEESLEFFSGSVLEPTYSESSVPTTVGTTTTVVESYEVVSKDEIHHKRLATPSVDLAPSKVFHYKKGDGVPEFDDIILPSVDAGYLFPVVPMKTDINPGRNPNKQYIDKNQSIGYLKDLYYWNRTLVRKVTDRKTYDEIIGAIKDIGKDRKNDDEATHKDINYAYIMYGTSVNSPEPQSAHYMYKFFKEFKDYNTAMGTDYDTFLADWQRAYQSRLDYIEWDSQQIPCGHYVYGLKNGRWQRYKVECPPLAGTPAPKIRAYPNPPRTTINIRTSSRYGLKYYVNWSNINEFEGTGRILNLKNKHGKTMLDSRGLDRLEIWYEREAYEVCETGGESGTYCYTAYRTVLRSKVERDRSTASMLIYFQETPDTWKALRVHGLNSKNTIYDGRSVSQDIIEAFSSSDESPLLIPLQDNILRSMGIVHGTQFVTASSYLLLNHYIDKVIKVYRGFVKWLIVIVVVVIVVVVTIATAGTGAAPAGSLGATVAASLGMSGVAALAATVAVNMIAGMILSKLIMKLAVSMFGPKLGFIIGIVASIAMGSAIMSGGINMADVFSGPNLLSMTDAVVGGYFDYRADKYNKKAEKIADEIAKEMDSYTKTMDEIERKYIEEFGDRMYIDAIKYSQRDNHQMNQMAVETPDKFFTRTLMLGSDIAEMSMASTDITSDISLLTHLDV